MTIGRWPDLGRYKNLLLQTDRQKDHGKHLPLKGFMNFNDWINTKNGHKKGRPKKKPTYNEEMIMQELLSAISNAYLTGGRSKGTSVVLSISLLQLANEFDITLMKARKLLITAGVYHTEISDEVNECKCFKR